MWRSAVNSSPLRSPEMGTNGMTADRAKVIRELHDQMYNAEDFETWHQAAILLDILECRELWKVKPDSPFYDHALVQKTVEKLEEARNSNDFPALAYHLRNSLHRNFGGLENIQLYEHTHAGTKHLLEQYVKEVVTSMEYLVNSGDIGMTIQQKLGFFKEIRRLYGRSALLLSGGAAFGIYHLGVIKALVNAGLLPRVISGSSAGSIVASIIAVKTDQELPEFFNAEAVQLDFFGEDDTIFTKMKRFFREGVVLDIDNIRTSFRGYLGDITFLEAYERTGRTLNITVTHAIRLKKGARLLNHLTAPQVVIWSAACASCAAPGLFKPVHILAKTKEGDLVPFEATAQHYLDGSYFNDLPIDELSELFCVNFTIVSQVNPYVIPFIRGLRTRPPAQPGQNRMLWMYDKLSDFVKSEVQHRCVQAAELGIAPKILEFLVPIINQGYSGDITIVPDLRNDYRNYMHIISNPSDEVIQDAVLCGMRSTWPALAMIANHYSIERTIFEAVERLRVECSRRNSQDMSLVHPEFKALAHLHMLNANIASDPRELDAKHGQLATITIAALDRPGLLADISLTLAKIGLLVKNARMMTSGSWAFHVFNVRVAKLQHEHEKSFIDAIHTVFENLLFDEQAQIQVRICPDHDDDLTIDLDLLGFRREEIPAIANIDLQAPTTMRRIRSADSIIKLDNQ
uniref:PNPLA domain-containing protein n=1 Tax=Spongospora subterranea TaxID=70186 RepID=A0A0H5R767_9EUKA|eukprot:CRZ09597.1 hypothetical protein [Spongospora subterranea]